MSESQPPIAGAPQPAEPAKVDGLGHEHAQGVSVDVGGDEEVDGRLAKIEMAGEEVAAGFRPAPHHALSPDVRYLHVSRTIHELITDRNRAVGIFLFVASVLFGSSSALLNAHPVVDPILPLASIQYWCLPVTFGVLTVIAVFTTLLLIRSRIGLIFEVTKMNTLLGLPAERVRRVNPLSIFFLMYTLTVVLGAGCAGLTAAMLMMHDPAKHLVLSDHGMTAAVSRTLSGPVAARATTVGVVTALLFLVVFQALYYAAVLRATADLKPQNPKA